MRKPVVTIFYQFDPWYSTIGGIQTLIKTFIQYAPQEFKLRLVGINGGSHLAIGKWHEAELYGKALLFMPLFSRPNDNIRHVVPTTLKYTLGLVGRNLSSDFMHFHRIEPTLVTRHWSGEKMLFVHNDMRQQIQASGSAKAMLWNQVPQIYFALERSLIEQFSQIFVCHSESVQLYRNRYPRIAPRISYIKNTVDSDRFYPLYAQQEQHRLLLSRQLNLPDHTRFILFAGRLHPQKDPLLLVQSFAALNEPGVHLLIAGDGELQQVLQQQVRTLGLTPHVSFLGAVQQPQLVKLYQVASVFVLTSLYEGLPLAVLEALASGIPVVTTNCGETPNFLTSDSGVVCLERQPQAIAAALRQVLQFPERYPVSACLQAMRPYEAKMLMHELYDEMLDRWQSRLAAISKSIF
ncbi:MAG: glycosyltransferase family 4 protein [Elainella sp. Prado103]|jgi:glycosyltransferase involved in cell wall biosynthesis|nr:glycosyltransferase family 4 protein [Elainella sp. Prado103]